MSFHFYSNAHLLFVLGDPADYDTATPYRYAVGRFVELAEEIKQGNPVTVIQQSKPEMTFMLRTIDELLYWISEYFNGFDQFVKDRID